jgi:hypothetical protein
LLVFRAQYITGASGAAIALRRNGKKDMLCRASTGANAPELGALLSTEFGLSGESVRTRKPLRCDDAERDARVNREVCRQLGIASVVVMPVVNDDEVLGVFELFSGKANAFGERDLSAIRRLSEMVETAVRLADAAQSLTERLKAGSISAAENAEREGQVLEGEVLEDISLSDSVLEELILEDGVLAEPPAGPPVAGEAGAEKIVPDAAAEAKTDGDASEALPEDSVPMGETAVAASQDPRNVEIEKNTEATSAVAATAQEPKQEPAQEPTAAHPTETIPSKKSLFWSAALNPAADAGKPAAESDQSHVPPVLRALRKCQACGFPVSASRVLCVECEEKKWRGQRLPSGNAPRQTAKSAPAGGKENLPVPEAVAPTVTAQTTASSGVSSADPLKESEGSTVVHSAVVHSTAVHSTVQTSAPVDLRESKPVLPAIPAEPAANSPERKIVSRLPVQPKQIQTLPAPSSEFVLSAGLEPSQSWLAANKYILIVLVLLAVVVGAFLLLR